ncbi:MAG: hypothetical protein R3C10_08810 [Pirellulales bacterium]
MVTGLYPHEHLITGNDPPKELDRNVMLKHIRATRRVCRGCWARTATAAFKAASGGKATTAKGVSATA